MLAALLYGWKVGQFTTLVQSQISQQLLDFVQIVMVPRG